MAFASGFAVVVLFLPSGPAGAQGIKVNDPLAIGTAGDVTTSQLSPDSTRVVYLADQDADEVFRVYSVPIGDGSPVALGTAPVQGGDVRAFEISPSSRHVVYRGDQDADEVFELYSVSIAGRGPATRLNVALPPGADVAGFEIAPRTERVVFGVEAAGGIDYFSVPIMGGVPVQLNAPLAPGERVQRQIVSPDGRHVLYQTGPNSGEISDLYRVSILGGPVVQLDPPLEHPRAFEFSPDSKHVVFLSSKLYATTPLGGPAIELAEGASGFQILADSSRVLFLAPGDTHRDQLHLVRITGGPAQKLTEHGQQRVNNFLVSPDLQRIAYALEAGDSVGEIRTIPSTGGPSTPIQLGNELYVGLISPDSSRLVYAELSDSQSGGPILYSVPLAGGTSTRLTDRPVVPLGITPDAKTVICYDYYFSDEATGVFSVPITGGPTVQLTPSAVSGGAIVVEPDCPLLTRDGSRLVYRADQDFDEVFELFSVSTQGGPVQKLNAPLAQGGIAGDVRFSAVSPDGRRVAYLADQDTDEVLELYSAAIPGGAPVKLNGALVRNGDVSEFAFMISQDSSRVVYVADQELDGIRQLYSVPIDGGVPVRLNSVPAVAFGIYQFRISRDSRRVVFAHDQVNALRAELFSVPIDGGAVVDLSASLPALHLVSAFEISADSRRVVFGALQDGDGVNLELYSVPIDGGPTLKLNPTPVANGGVAGGFQLLADSSGVVYPAALEVEGRVELYHTPIAGGPSTKLSPPLSADQDVFVHPTSPDASYVVFRVDRFPDGPSELYSTSLAGFVRTKLNPPLVAGGSVRGFEISADSSRVVYRADQGVNELYELFSVPIGGGSATRVSAPMVAGGDVDSFQISGDSSRVAYLADQDANDVFELYSVPLAGGASVKLSSPLVSGGDVLYGFAIRRGRVLYRADQEQNDVIELFAAPLAGGAPPEKLNAPLVASGDVLDSFFPFQPTGNAILYRADQDADEVVELYLSFLSVPSRSSGRSDTASPPP